MTNCDIMNKALNDALQDFKEGTLIKGDTTPELRAELNKARLKPNHGYIPKEGEGIDINNKLI